LGAAKSLARPLQDSSLAWHNTHSGDFFNIILSALKGSIMPKIKGAVPKSQFALYDLTTPGLLGEFQSLTGGEQTISLITYKTIDPSGNVTNHYMPGQTTFASVKLTRPMDSYAKEVYLKMKDAMEGKLKDLRRDYSVSLNDSQGKPLVYWHLKNALPSVLSGFSFNMANESSYMDFEVTLQAESIEIVFQ
jgi:phage tail-like protein